MTENEFYPLLLKAWFGLSVVVFITLQFLSAPYGRHTREGWGPKIPNQLGWIIMELPAVLTITACYLQADAKLSTPAFVFLAMWQLHYINRTFIFPWRTYSGPKPMPLIVAFLGASTNVGIGYLIGRGLTFFGPVYDKQWFTSPAFVVGCVIFFIGFLINLQSDNILIRLRKPGESGYKIPRGGLYKYVSCPNYFGEILEWGGFALATSNLGALAFWAWTMSNLIPRAVQNHQWYLSKFEDYPKNRRKLIPFIF